MPLVAGLFGARVPPVTWLAAAAAVGGVSLLESGGSEAANGEWVRLLTHRVHSSGFRVQGLGFRV